MYLRYTLDSPAEMAQVDHRVDQRLDCTADITDDLVPNQHTTKFVFSSDHAFDGVKAFFEDGGTENMLGSALSGLSVTRVLIDVGNLAPVEDLASWW